jgi:hypothetical protein
MIGRRGDGEDSVIRREDELFVGRIYVETPDGNRTFKTTYDKTHSRCEFLQRQDEITKPEENLKKLRSALTEEEGQEE